MNEQDYFFIIILTTLLGLFFIQYFNNNEKFSNFIIGPKTIDCGLYSKKNDCDSSYQCVWNEEPVENVKTPFCTGNILYVPPVSFDNY